MRFVTAGNFAFAVLAFFLPWIELRCESKDMGKMSVLQQSGYEIAAGKYTEGSTIREMKKDLPGGMQQKDDKPKGLQGQKDPEATPLLYGYVCILAAGIVLSLIPGKIWRVGALACALIAAALLGVQTAQGFPMEQQTKEMNDLAGNAKDNVPKQPNANPFQINIEPPKVYVAYMFGFYLAWLLTLLPLLWTGLAFAMSTPPKKPRRGFDDEEDDYDDLESDRDRRKERGSNDGDHHDK
jgi:hypothetical protein